MSNTGELMAIATAHRTPSFTAAAVVSAAKVLHNPELSKAAKVASGRDLTQRRK